MNARSIHIASCREARGRSAHASGFTLVELIVAIVLFSILILLALPSFTGMLTNWRLRASAETLSAGLQTARTEALRRNTPVEFRMEGGGWSVIAPGGEIVDGRATTEAGPNGAVAITPHTTVVVFTPRGAVQGGLGTTFSVAPAAGGCTRAGSSDGARCMNVVVSAGGQVRMCDPSIDSKKLGDTRRCL